MQVSIIINNYNYSGFVAASIESALAQSYENVEVVVIDDGSTDNSRAILEKYREKVKLLYKENGGQGSALNHGFKACEGDIIFFLDADDVLSPSCVETVIPRFADDVCKVHFNLEVIDGKGQPLEPLFHKDTLPAGDLIDQTLSTGLVDSMPMSGNAFRRDFLEAVFPIDEMEWRRSADVYLFNLATLFGQVAAIDAPLGGYRVHGQNISKNIENGRLNHKRVSQLVDRNVKMDKCLARFAERLGHVYHRGKLLTESSHVQLQFIVHASAAPEKRVRIKDRASSFFKFVASLSQNKLAAHKVFAITLMSFFILLSPHRTAERLCVMSYRLGMVLSANKTVQNMKA